MNLTDAKKTAQFPLRQCTLLFLVKDKQVLLALKKRGFGQGKWNGVGGKLSDGETTEDAAIRETQEEIGVTPKNLKQVATLDFFFPKAPQDKEWNQQVIVYLCDKWIGKPEESEEMAPKWFDTDRLPFDKMWPDDKLWLPKTLQGARLKAEFVFGDNDVIDDYSLVEEE